MHIWFFPVAGRSVDWLKWEAHRGKSRFYWWKRAFFGLWYHHDVLPSIAFPESTSRCSGLQDYYG